MLVHEYSFMDVHMYTNMLYVHNVVSLSKKIKVYILGKCNILVAQHPFFRKPFLAAEDINVSICRMGTLCSASAIGCLIQAKGSNAPP